MAMNPFSRPINQPLDRLRRPPKDVASVIASCSMLLTIVFLLHSYQARLPYQHLSRYICLLPIALLAHRYGTLSGLISSAFLSLFFVPGLFDMIRWQMASTSAIEATAFVVFLNLFAYVAGDVGRAMRRHEVLTKANQEWQALLTVSASPEQVSAYLLQEAQQVSGADSVALLRENPTLGHWLLETLTGRTVLSLGLRDEPSNLATWLAQHDQPLRLVDPGLEQCLTDAIPEGICSLLSLPVLRSDGSLSGHLLLINSDLVLRSSLLHALDDYLHLQWVALESLVARAAQSLELADLYSRTDRDLLQRVHELATIEHSAAQLNAALYVQQIAQGVLDCAMRLRDTWAALVHLFPSGLALVSTWRTLAPTDELIQRLQALAAGLQNPQVLTAADDLPASDEGAAHRSRILIPIRRQESLLGLLYIESCHSQLESEKSLSAFASLAHHAATALQNTRLFWEIQRERNRTELVIDSMADALITTDDDRRILTINPSAERLTGWSNEEAIGKRCCEVLHCQRRQGSPPGDLREDCLLTAAIKKGDVVQDERHVVQHLHGTTTAVSISAAPILEPDGEPSGVVLLLRDMTEREELERLQRELLAAFSHELRSPLTNICTMAELYAEAIQKLDSEQVAEEHLGQLAAQCRRVAGFADKFLAAFRLSEGQLRLELRPLPVNYIVRDVVGELHLTLQGYHLVLAASEPSPWVLGDEMHIKTVLVNLLDNAAKFSAPGSIISVTVEREAHTYVTIIVQDQGIGIPPAQQDRVFERFYRLNAGDSQQVYGHGLGLYIARKLAQAMGGQLWVESREGEGSRFFFSLRLMQEHVSERGVESH